MTNERWGRVEELFQEAASLAADERFRFLAHACGNDSDLLREVESLLEHDQSGTSPIGFAVEQAIDDLPQNSTDATCISRELIGQTISHYQVLSLLGVGGMGEVYAGRDTRLGRLVALKILPAYLTDDSQLKRSLLQEAKTASALNHHGIVTLYDVGSDSGIDYLVMEYVPGRTLEKFVPNEGLDYKTALRYAIEIADAVAVAHAAGIVHRDLKPSNIMVTETGTVKVLDFGLARLEQSAGANDSRGGATEKGLIAGTPAYMSPEQAQGRTLDARSDIFSFGLVLYEMLTGQHPFRQADRGATLQAITQDQPPPLRDKRPQIPAELERIVLRCLSKQPEQRFQSMGAVKGALEELRQRRYSKRIRLWLVIAACIVVIVAAALLYRARIPRMPSVSEWVRLTDFADSAVQPAFSPDGKLLAFIRGPDTFMSPGQIYVERLRDHDVAELTHDDTVKASPVFSPDGSQIAYSVAPAWDTWVVPATGGVPSKLMLRNASALTWIDNDHILFSEIKLGRHMAVVTAARDKTNAHDVYVPPQQAGMAHRSYISPDHKWVLVMEHAGSGGGLPCRVIPLDGSSAGQPVGPEHSTCVSAAWSPNGRWMYFTAATGKVFHIWRQRFGDARAQQITFGATDEEGVAMAPDGHSFVTSVGFAQNTLWVHDTSGDRQVSSLGHAYLPNSDDESLTHSVFPPDKRKLYYLSGDIYSQIGGGTGQLWTVSLDTDTSRPVVTGFDIQSYDVSPDGKRVVFGALDTQSKSHLYLASLEGKFPPRLIGPASAFDSRVIYTPSGELYFQSQEGGSTFIYRMKEDGTGREKVIRDPIVQFQGVSPDEKWVLAQATASDRGQPRGTFAYTVGGHSRTLICPGFCIPSWSPDGKSFDIALFGMARSAEMAATFAIPLSSHEILPRFPPGGIKTEDDVRALKGVKITDGVAYFSPDSSLYAYTKSSVHRNLYRIPVP